MDNDHPFSKPKPTGWESGFVFSVPVAALSGLGLASGLNDVFWPLTILCVLISFPWNLIAGLLLATIIFPLTAYLNLNGYLGLASVFYLALIFGAHFNGYLLFSKKSH